MSYIKTRDFFLTRDLVIFLMKKRYIGYKCIKLCIINKKGYM